MLLACGALMWLLARYTVVSTFSIPGQTVLSGITMLAGVVIIFRANGTLRKHRTTGQPGERALTEATHLVTTGPYRFSRNPIYLGMVLLLVGWALIWSGWPSIAVVIAFVLFITRFQIMPEEKALEHLFDKKYIHYKNQVRRWI